MESLNVKNINDEKIFNVIDPNGQGEVVNRIRPISISINQKAETMNDQTNSTINLAVYWNDTWKSILDLTFDESLRQEYGKLTEDLTKIQKDIDMKQYKDAETKTNDFLKYVANLSSKYTAIPEKAVVSKTKNDFVKVIADKNSVKATISDKLLNFMLKKYAKVDTLDYTKANECFSTSKFNFLANNYDFYYHSPEIFQKQAYMTVVKDNKVVGSYKVNYDQFSKFASKFMLTPQKLGYSKDRLAGYMKTAEVVMQNIFFDSVDEAKEWQEMVDEKKKEQATSPEGEEETTETTTTETKTKTEMGEGKSESPVKEDGGLARPSEDFASDEIPESEPRQQEQQGGGQNLGASRRLNLLKKKAAKEYVVTDEWQEKNSKGELVTRKMREELSAKELIDFAVERWDADYEDEEITDLDSAIKWLEENGFKVSKQASKKVKLNKKVAYNIVGPKQEFYATIDLPKNGIKIENYSIANDKGKVKFSFAFNNADFKFYMLNDSIDMQLSGNIVATIISNDFKFGDNNIEENDLLIWLNTEIPYLEVHGIVEDTPKGIQLKDVYCGALQNADFISAHLEDVIIDDIKIDNNIEDIYYKQYTTIKNSNKNLKLNKKAGVGAGYKLTISGLEVDPNSIEITNEYAKDENSFFIEFKAKLLPKEVDVQAEHSYWGVSDTLPIVEGEISGDWQGYNDEETKEDFYDELKNATFEISDIRQGGYIWHYETENFNLGGEMVNRGKGAVKEYIGGDGNIEIDWVFIKSIYIADAINDAHDSTFEDEEEIEEEIDIENNKKINVEKQANKNLKLNKKAEEQTIEEKIEEAETSGIVKGTIGVGDIVTVCIDKLEYPEEAFKYTELIGEPLILMENDKEDINKVIVEQTEYPFQRMTVNKDDICQYAEIKGTDIVVEDVDGDEMITTFEELPVVAKQCKIKSIHKAANITKKKANLTKKANSLEDVAGLIDDILSDYDWYDYADQLEVGEKSHYENILADLQKDEKGTIEALFNRVSEDDEEYSSPKIEQLKEYYNAKFGGK